jgi:hypothetical protein
MICRYLLVPVLILLAAGQAPAALLRVRLIPELSDEKVWRLEVRNDSVDTLDVRRLTATFLADGRRLWSVPATLTPSLLRPGETGWVTLDASLPPKRFPLQIDWELTWNPHAVPVLPRFWKTERVASIEIRQAHPSMPAAQPPGLPAPRRTPGIPLWRF